MRRTIGWTTWWVGLAVIAMLVACGDDAGAPMNQDAGHDAQVAPACTSNQECDNGLHCDGEETCDPSDPSADPITHCVAGVSVVCDDSVACTTDSCDEARGACVALAPDADGDGHRDAACVDTDGEPMGDDCDDADGDRYPGRTEACNPETDDAPHDEDCNATTFGTRDMDGDTHVDLRCCNTDAEGMERCGDDCDDTRASAYAGLQEICDGLDNDCDSASAIDNGLFCGACMCSVPNATPSCTAGAMQCTVGVCDTGYLNCDANQANGCEARRDADTSCGECGTVCTEHASCGAAGDGTFACECDDGFMGDGVTCTNVDECATDHGGCDPLVTCTDNTGSRLCGDCPAGYIGDGEAGCDPVLLGLVPSHGSLSPALNTNGTSYSLTVPVGVHSVGLVPTVATDVSIAIDNAPATPGATWQTPMLMLGDNLYEIEVAQAGRATRQYTLTVTRGGPIDYLKASNTGPYDHFGQSVAIEGNTLVIGASDESSAATTINGDQNDDSADYAGAAFVFVWNGQAWVQQAYLKAHNGEAYDYFGWRVAIDGDTIAVSADEENSAVPGDPDNNGAFSSGAVYVFVRTGTTWTQQAYLKAAFPGAGDYFGEALALEGDTLVIGADGERSSARTVDGDQNNDNAQRSGAAYVFERSGTAWTQRAYLKASNADAYDYFGHSVSLSGDTIVVGAAGESSDATTINGDGNNNGAGDAGAAYVFVRSGNSWAQQAYLKPSNGDALMYFGYSVTISGDRIAVGAYGESSSTRGINTTPNQNGYDNGAVYVFERSGTSWAQTAYLKASNSDETDYFGSDVDLEGDTLVVGANGEEGGGSGLDADAGDNTAGGSGAIYVYANAGGSWAEIAYLKALSPDAVDELGYCVALSDGVVVGGARTEDGDGTGSNGNPAHDSVEDSGAAYVFR